MRRTEDGLIPTVLAIAGALPWVASWGGAWLVSATTRSTVSAGSGGMREGRVLSRVNPSTPLCMKRSCQRHTTVLPLPTARVMAVVRLSSAVRAMIRARHTCFCGLLRSRMIDCKRTRSAGVTVMEIPLRITNNRTKPNLQKLLSDSSVRCTPLGCSIRYEVIGNSPSPLSSFHQVPEIPGWMPTAQSEHPQSHSSHLAFGARCAYPFEEISPTGGGQNQTLGVRFGG